MTRETPQRMEQIEFSRLLLLKSSYKLLISIFFGGTVIFYCLHNVKLLT